MTRRDRDEGLGRPRCAQHGPEGLGCVLCMREQVDRLQEQLAAAARVYDEGVGALEARVAAVEGARRELQRDAEVLAREVVRLLVVAGRGGSA